MHLSYGTYMTLRMHSVLQISCFLLSPTYLLVRSVFPTFGGGGWWCFVLFFSFGIGWGRGCLGFSPPHKLLCMGKAKHFFFFLVCKTMRSLREIRGRQTKVPEKSLDPLKTCFLYGSCIHLVIGLRGPPWLLLQPQLQPASKEAQKKNF